MPNRSPIRPPRALGGPPPQSVAGPCAAPLSRPVALAVAFLAFLIPSVVAALVAGGAALADDPPQGEVLSFQFTASTIFPGTVRDYQVYVPAQYDGRTPACVHVNQDGIQFDAPRVFDRLIHEGRMPVTIGVFVMHGRVPAGRDGALDRFNRSYEYDGLGDAYVRFLLEELLPDVETRVATDGRTIRLSTSGNDRSIGGTSSGAIAAFTAAWERPDAFRRVFSGIGTFVGLRGGNEYPTLIRKAEPKPIRVFLQAGSKDLDIYGGDWWIANQAMQRSLAFAGYEVRHVYGDGGHDNRQATEVFPDAMAWLWEGWPAAPARGQGSPQLQEILLPGEEWRVVGEGYGAATAPEVDAGGRVSFVDAAGGTVYRVEADGSARPDPDGLAGTARATAPDGRTIAAGTDGDALVSKQGNAAPVALARGWRAADVVVDAAGRAYATEPAAEAGEGAVHVIGPDGRDVRVGVPLVRPSGLCLSPDQTLLYVADGADRWVWNYSVGADGSLTNGQRYDHLHVPDTATDAGTGGLRVDRDGRLWAATRLGLQVCDQAGRVNAIIPVPSGRPTALCFGGTDGDTVFVTCGDKVFARRLRVRGAPAFLAPTTPPKPRL